MFEDPFDEAFDPLRAAKIEALSDEHFHHKDRRGTFLMYGIFAAVGIIVLVFRGGHDPFWTQVSLALFVVMFPTCLTLWIYSWVEARRLRKIILRMDRTYPF